jgi:hypothetical protein
MRNSSRRIGVVRTGSSVPCSRSLDHRQGDEQHRNCPHRADHEAVAAVIPQLLAEDRADPSPAEVPRQSARSPIASAPIPRPRAQRRTLGSSRGALCRTSRERLQAAAAAHPVPLFKKDRSVMRERARHPFLRKVGPYRRVTHRMAGATPERSGRPNVTPDRRDRSERYARLGCRLSRWPEVSVIADYFRRCQVEVAASTERILFLRCRAPRPGN